jgi:hypothetical protein
MNRRMLLLQGGVAAVGVGVMGLSGRLLAAPRRSPSGLGTYGFPEVTISVNDSGFDLPTGTAAGRVVMTVENTGTTPLHFFAARVPDDIDDEQLATDLGAGGDPAWFDMHTLPLLGNPDWPAPGGRAQGIIDLSVGRWLMFDPLEGRAPTIWTVAESAGADSLPEPEADVEISMAEMTFTGLETPVAAGKSVWKIANAGTIEHEVAVLPVPAGTDADGVVEMLSDMLRGEGDPSFFAPVGGQGVASAGVTTWQELTLDAGTYAAVCMTPMSEEDFVPHAMMGMAAIFEVR